MKPDKSASPLHGTDRLFLLGEKALSNKEGVSLLFTLALFFQPICVQAVEVTLVNKTKIDIGFTLRYGGNILRRASVRPGETTVISQVQDIDEIEAFRQEYEQESGVPNSYRLVSNTIGIVAVSSAEGGISSQVRYDTTYYNTYWQNVATYVTNAGSSKGITMEQILTTMVGGFGFIVVPLLITMVIAAVKKGITLGGSVL